MATVIKPLGMSEDEIREIEKTEGPWSKKARRKCLDMYHTPLPTQTDVEVFEAAVGALPQDYREFLFKFNGGIPVPNILVTLDNELVVNYFFALNCPYGSSKGLRGNIENYSTRIPQEMIPIASSGGGDLILLRLSIEHYGSVHYWHHEWEADENASSYFENVEFIASSFNEFLNLLCEVE